VLPWVDAVLPLGFTRPLAPGTVTRAAAPVGADVADPFGGTMPVVTTGVVLVVTEVGRLGGVVAPVRPALVDDVVAAGTAAVVMTGPAPAPASLPPQPPSRAPHSAAATGPRIRRTCGTGEGKRAADNCFDFTLRLHKQYIALAAFRCSGEQAGTPGACPRGRNSSAPSAGRRRRRPSARPTVATTAADSNPSAGLALASACLARRTGDIWCGGRPSSRAVRVRSWCSLRACG
jgi:hypothetical protein